MQPSALILAGTRPGGDPFARSLGISHKALIKLEDRSLLERVVSALRAAGLERIVVSGDDDAVIKLARDLRVEVIEPAAGPSASVARALEAFGTPMLVTTSDHALLEAAHVTQMIKGTAHDTDLTVMLAERERVEKAMPGSRRTYLRFSDGHWSGCNLFYFQTERSREAIKLWSMVEADRKRPWRIAAKLGIGTLFAMALGRLRIDEAVARLGARIGIRAGVVAARDGRAAIDIDKQADLEAVTALLESAK